MKALLVLNDAPYGSERTYNGLRLAGSLSRQEGLELRVFLLGDAVGCAKAGQRVVAILGGGVGGLVAANELARRLPPGHRIVVVEKAAAHAFAPSFLWLMTGERRAEQITRNLRGLGAARRRGRPRRGACDRRRRRARGDRRRADRL